MRSAWDAACDDEAASTAMASACVGVRSLMGRPLDGANLGCLCLGISAIDIYRLGPAQGVYDSNTLETNYSDKERILYVVESCK